MDKWAESKKRYAKTHPIEVKASQKRYRETHKKEISNHNKEVYKKNKEKINKRNYLYKKNNPERKKKQDKQYRKDHVKEKIEWTKKYRKTDKGKAVQQCARNKRRMIMKNNCVTTDEWLEIRNKSPMCSACGRFVECENLTMDHIFPLLGENSCGLHIKNNIQPLCKNCNSSKSNKEPMVIQ